MNCSACKDRLPAYRDGELSHAERALIGAHLLACASCAAHERVLADLDRVLEAVRPVQPRADFTIGVMAKIAGLPVRRPFWNAYRVLGAFVGAEIVAIVVAVLTGRLHLEALAASAATFVAKVAVAVTALVDVAADFHLGPVALAAAAFEIAAVALLFFAIRAHLNRRSLGAHTYGV